MSDLGFKHRFVPSTAGPSERAILLLHGTGANEDDLIPLGRELDPFAALLSPRGQILENGMPRFFRRLAEGVFDEKDLVSRAQELAEFIKAAAEEYELDLQQLVAVGYSNGANIAAAVLLLRPEVLNTAILFRAMVPLEPSPLPNLTGKRILISSGQYDPIIPAENVRRLTAMFQAAGADVSLRFESAGHGLAAGDIEAAKNWLS
jgi:phospholipase/carboxylesterase